VIHSQPGELVFPMEMTRMEEHGRAFIAHAPCLPPGTAGHPVAATCHRAATRPASCWRSMKRRSSYPIAPASGLSIPSTTSPTTRTLACFSSSPVSGIDAQVQEHEADSS